VVSCNRLLGIHCFTKYELFFDLTIGKSGRETWPRAGFAAVPGFGKPNGR
jgi:hypothetical protein